MRRHLDLTSLLSAEIFNEINKRRVALGIDPLEAVTPQTDLSAGIEGRAIQTTFDKQSALRDVQALVDWLAGTTAFAALVMPLNEVLEDLAGDSTILASLQQRSFVETGPQLLSDAMRFIQAIR